MGGLIRRRLSAAWRDLVGGISRERRAIHFYRTGLTFYRVGRYRDAIDPLQQMIALADQGGEWSRAVFNGVRTLAVGRLAEAAAHCGERAIAVEAIRDQLAAFVTIRAAAVRDRGTLTEWFLRRVFSVRPSALEQTMDEWETWAHSYLAWFEKFGPGGPSK